MNWYPPVEPYASGFLDVGDGNQVYWEECGRPDGKPAVFLHGGPGGGCIPVMRRFFDPDRYRIVLLDQRGCGRSRPHASEAGADLSVNTTWHLVADLERLRQDRRIERWLVFGGSWGSALALAYAEEHPERVSELILRGVFTLRRRELDWYYNGGAGELFPERYEEFLAPLAGRRHAHTQHDHCAAGDRAAGDRATGDRAAHDNVAAYADLLFDPDPAVHEPAAVAWSTWESATTTLVEDPAAVAAAADARFAVAFARIENHYFTHAGWFDEGQLLDRAFRLADIPGVIVQGRYDIATPPVTAWQLARAWPTAQLVMVPAAGHSGAEPAMRAELVAATDRFARP